MVDRRLALMTGTDIPMDSVPLVFHQPQLREIGMIGEKPFLSGVQYLIVDKDSDIEQKLTILKDITNFDVFISLITHKDNREYKENVLSALQIFFPAYDSVITPNGVIIKEKSNNNVIAIDDNSFDELQMLISEALCLDKIDSQQRRYNPQSEKAREIAEKLKRGREIAAKYRGEDSSSTYGNYMSSIAVALGISLVEVSKFTIYQLYDLVERYMLKVDWDIDIKARLAGAKPDKHPDNWMKNIH